MDMGPLEQLNDLGRGALLMLNIFKRSEIFVHLYVAQAIFCHGCLCPCYCAPDTLENKVGVHSCYLFTKVSARWPALFESVLNGWGNISLSARRR